ncbi:hypothetical protein HF325_002907 [Metschnikowia pulcherrima]|uniref:Uncharacterized protein n=1 Tax=Metschnikowia pulcherrima TaxID=27326 RepID=A0A8H7GSU0_9ASCO|nr:hypothetical protein HF325_002907 [Metschnikowia pulcherrima]
MQALKAFFWIVGLAIAVVSSQITQQDFDSGAISLIPHTKVCPECYIDAPIEVEDILDLLGMVQGHLKSFILETQFFYERFEKASGGLGQALGTIYNHVVVLEEYDLNIVCQLVFTMYMFEAMNDATKNARKFNYWGNSDQYLVLCLIEVNVAFFALCNSLGLLDRRIIEHEEKLKRYQAQIDRWTDEFGNLKNVSEGVQSAFMKERKKAEHTIKVLKSQVAQID